MNTQNINKSSAAELPPPNLYVIIREHIDTSYDSHNYLSRLANALNKYSNRNIIIDFSHTQFIAANQFAILGSIIDSCISRNCKITLGKNTPPKIVSLFRRNGFCNYFKLTNILDKNNTTIPYKRFDVNSLDEYERYLTISLFSRSDLPKMSPGVSDEIRDYLLEVFKNVKDHTSSSYIYTCGQFFPKTSLLYFSIVDTGETISYNVHRYHKDKSLEIPKSCLAWALEIGNTTLDEGRPRGLGLSLVKDFVNLNSGAFYIISGSETFEISKGKQRYLSMKNSFPGTIVTMAFNLNDHASYFMKSELIPTIQF